MYTQFNYIRKVSWIPMDQRLIFQACCMTNSPLLFSSRLHIYQSQWFFMTEWGYEKLNNVKIIGILLPKLFWPTVRKKLFYWSRKTFEIEGWRPRICKNFEITWTIYSNSERSEQFLVTECFFNLFLEVSQI